MEKEQLAEQLNGIEYGDSLFNKLHVFEETIKESGLVVVYGASDDLLEFAGAISNELGAYNGRVYWIKPSGKINRKGKGKKILAQWAPDTLDCSWLITSEIPNTPFDIMEDGELFCRGLVFNIKDLNP